MTSDRDIVKLFSTDQHRALKALHDKYADACYCVALRYLKEKFDAEEAVADAFINAYMHLPKFEFRNDGSLYPWLKKITVNQCLMRLRKKNIQFLEFDPTFVEVADVDILQSLAYEDLLNLLSLVPHHYSLVFQLYEIEGYNHSEIAEILGISSGSSKAYLHHAKNQMKKILAENYNLK